MSKTDDQFFKRADEHINLANKYLSTTSRGKVSASMMYSVARFNAWLSACEFNSAEEMKAAKEEMVDYFTTEYKKMLIENLDDHIEHFEERMK